MKELAISQCEEYSEYAEELDARIESLLMSIDGMETEND